MPCFETFEELESAARGSLDLLSPATVQEAVRSVRTGETYGLNSPLHWPSPPLFGRPALEHKQVVTPGGNNDEILNQFNPQNGSQWDGLGHIPLDGELHRGLTIEELGVHHWADHAIVGRGVLLDVARYREEIGDPVDWRSTVRITADELEETRRRQGVEKRRGDILLIRTGWVTGYNLAGEEERHHFSERPAKEFTAPGLATGEAMVRYLTEWGLAAIAADNPALEAMPSPETGKLHHELIPKRGIPIGEFWWLDRLAEACAIDRTFDFLLVSAPLNLYAGVGSTANAVAIR